MPLSPVRKRGVETSTTQSVVEFMRELGKTRGEGVPYEYNPIVNIGVRAIWEGFSRLPLEWWTGDPKKEGSKPTKEAPLDDLFQSPRVGETAEAFWEQNVNEYKRRGLIFWFCADFMGYPIEDLRGIGLGRIPDQIILVNKGKAEAVTRRVDGYETLVGWRYRKGSWKSPVFPPSSVICVNNYRPSGAEKGLGAEEVLADDIRIWDSAAFGMDKDMGASDGGAYLVYEKPLVGHQRDLVQAEADDLEDSQSKIKVLTGGPKVVANPIKPVDKKYSEVRSDVRDTILAYLGVPPNVVGFQDNATYENLAVSYKQLWRGPLGIVSMAAVFQGAIRELQRRLRLGGNDVREILYPWFSTADIPEAQDDHADKVEKAVEMVAKGTATSLNEALALLGVEVDPPESGNRRFLAAGLQEVVTNDPDADDPEPIFESLTAQQAQVLDSIVSAVKAGTKTPDEALAQINASFNIDPDKVAELVASIEVAPKPEAPEPEQDQEAADLEKDAVEKTEGTLETRAKSDHVKPDRVFAKKAVSWLNAHGKAQLKRIREVASGKRSSEGMTIRGDKVPKDSEWDLLLLAREIWAEKLEKSALPSIRRILRDGLKTAAKEINVGPIDATDPRVVAAFVGQTTKLAGNVSESTENAVREVILKAFVGVDNEKPLQVAIAEVLPELEDGLKRIYGHNERRAAAIARTETGIAQSSSRHLQYGEAGVTHLVWRISPSGEHRDSHAELDGVRIEYGERFANGLRHPHEPGAPASEIVNCSLDPDLAVTTAGGIKPICEVRVGDYVLTDKLRYRRVVRVRPEPEYTGVGVTLRTVYGEVRVTAGHPFKSGPDWYRADSLKVGDLIGVAFNSANVQQFQFGSKRIADGSELVHVGLVPRLALLGGGQERNDLSSSNLQTQVWQELEGGFPASATGCLKAANRTPVGVGSVGFGLVDDSTPEPILDLVQDRDLGVRDYDARMGNEPLSHLDCSCGETPIGVCESCGVSQSNRGAIHEVILSGETPILNIEYTEEVSVPAFNFAVDEDESYVLAGLISHNCRCRVTAEFNNDDEEDDL